MTKPKTTTVRAAASKSNTTTRQVRGQVGPNYDAALKLPRGQRVTLEIAVDGLDGDKSGDAVLYSNQKGHRVDGTFAGGVAAFPLRPSDTIDVGQTPYSLHLVPEGEPPQRELLLRIEFVS